MERARVAVFPARRVFRSTFVIGVAAMRMGMGMGLTWVASDTPVPVIESDILRVRRSTDSAEDDFKLSEEAELDTFVGAGDGCVATWYDDSGNDNDVTQSTTTLQPKVAISGVVQEGVKFDGTDDYLTLGARLTSGSVTELTVAAFVKTTASGAAAIIASEFNATGNQLAWYSRISSTGKFEVVVNQNGDISAYKQYSSPSAVNTGDWTHVAFTFSSGALTLYVNGSAVTPTKTLDNAVTSIFDTSSAFLIGARGELVSFFAGSLSHLYVAQAALTAGNIATLATGESVGSPLLWLPGNYTP